MKLNIKHTCQCTICKSTHCKEIEEKYIDWCSPYDLELEYPDVSAWSIINHCKMAGLDKKRNNNLIAFYQYFMNRGGRIGIPIDGHMALRASELMAKLEGRFPKEIPTVNVGVNITIQPEEEDKRLETGFNRFAHIRSNTVIGDN